MKFRMALLRRSTQAPLVDGGRRETIGLFVYYSDALQEHLIPSHVVNYVEIVVAPSDGSESTGRDLDVSSSDQLRDVPLCGRL